MTEDKLQQQIANLQKIQERRDTLQHNIGALKYYIEVLNAEDAPKYTRTMECKIDIDIHDGDYPSTIKLRVKKITPAIRDALVAECERQIAELEKELQPIINQYG